MKRRNLRDPIKAAEWLNFGPKDRTKSKRLQSKYGIDLAERNAVAKTQDYQCEICKVEEYLVTDHDHNKPGTFRGLICLTCNAGLGMFSDDTTILQSAIDYLNRKRVQES